MPRLLNTWTGEFVWVSDLRTSPYAILSHVWRKPEDGGEQSYQDVLKLQESVVTNIRKQQRAVLDELRCLEHLWPSLIPRPPNFTSRQVIGQLSPCNILSHPDLSDKIKGFCKIAREAGFRLAWNDACCIDQTSSAELSEAINSMYEWYRLSDICYVYLADVPDGDRPQDPKSRFQESRWHSRGWTLQELIAPEHVVFLTQTWRFLGTKMGLTTALEQRTDVDFDILVGRTTLDSVSVARKMSWASRRWTTRIEDRAYSLLGIFGLHMSPIYGEGTNAFFRLQEEIIRTIPDQSIFAWGIKFELLRGLSDKRRWNLASPEWMMGTEERSGLLASSPSAFLHCYDIAPIAPSSLARTLRIQESQVPPVHCIFTPEGVSIRLLCMSLSGMPGIRQTFKAVQFTEDDVCARCRDLGLGEVDTLAVLQCQMYSSTGTPSILALPLCRSPREGDKNNRTVHIGGCVGGCRMVYYLRRHDDDDVYLSGRKQDHVMHHVVYLKTRDLVELSKDVPLKVEEVTLLGRYPDHPVSNTLRFRDFKCFDSVDFCADKKIVFNIAPYSTLALGQLGIVPSCLRVKYMERAVILTTSLAFHGDGHSRIQHKIRLRLYLIWKDSGYQDVFLSVKLVGFKGPGLDGQQSPSNATSSVNASNRAFTNTPDVFGGYLDLDSHRNSDDALCIGILHWKRRAIVYAEHTVLSEKLWPGSARLLRIALEHPFTSHPSDDLRAPHLWLSIDISEERPFAPQIYRGPEGFLSVQTGDNVYKDKTPLIEHVVAPSSDTGIHIPTEDGEPRFAMQDSIDSLRQENDALRAQMAGLASQHSSQMQEMDQKISAVLARLDAPTTSQRPKTTTDAVRQKWHVRRHLGCIVSYVTYAPTRLKLTFEAG